jgi:hypothetical protein
MQISLTGSYSELVNFIHKLENGSYYVNIISLESKKSVQVEEKSATASPPADAGIFSVPASPSPFQPAQQPKTDKTEKDIINSVINVIIYTK